MHAFKLLVSEILKKNVPFSRAGLEYVFIFVAKACYVIIKIRIYYIG